MTRNPPRATACCAGAACAILFATVLSPGCRRQPPAQPVSGPAPLTAAEAIDLENRGVGLMGRFDFDAAVGVFSDLTNRAPDRAGDWVNLAIARLNRQQPGDVQAAMGFLDRALSLKPDDQRAAYCKGLLLLNGGKASEALGWFRRVADADPGDAYAVLYQGQCLLDAGDATAALPMFQQAARLDPTLRSAHYLAFQSLQQLRRRDEAQAQLAEFERLKDDPQARVVEFKYTRMGPKAEAAVTDAPPAPPPAAPPGPIFAAAAPLLLVNGAGLTWRSPAPADPLPVTVTAADIDGDGRIDLFITNALLVDGVVRNAVLLRRDAGFVADLKHPLAAVQGVNAALWGDFDNDGLTDAYLCRRGPNQLWRQVKPGEWQDVTDSARASGSDGGHDYNTVDGAFVDADHDGDLDLFLVRADGPNELLNNNGDGTFRPIAKQAGIAGDGAGAVGLAVADLNHDGAVDLIVLKRRPPNEVWMNDRLWRYHAADGFDAFRAAPLAAAVAADADAHGQVSLYTASPAGLRRWSPDAGGEWHASPFAPDASAAPGPLATADLDGTGTPALVFPTPTGWSAAGMGPDARPAFATETSAGSWLVAELEPGRGPSVVAAPPGGPPIIWRPGPGRFPFLTLSLTGRRSAADSMRSNASGVGVRVAARFGPRWAALSTLRPQSGPGQSAQPVSFGLGGAPKADFVRLIWPEGLMQTELDLAAGKPHRIEETQRQTSSCPLIFAWDGTRYAFVTDCLGVGGLGFAVAPGEYAPVRPWENVLLPAGLPAASGGRYRLKLAEPMEEACYLDSASLARYDLPPGWQMTLDERMGVNDPQPTGRPRFFRREMLPAIATNDRGEDVTDLVTRADGRAAGPGWRDPRFSGFTAEHSVELKFDRPLAEGPGEPMLLADGWIEYPYSQTMFAAWQAGVPFSAPTLEARAPGGRWVTVLDQFGYPAGMPRQMSVPIPVEKLPRGATELRLRTNQEIYWDRLAVAWAEPCPDARRVVLPLLTARLADVGFPRRTTGPQRRPEYDYDRRAPLWDTRRQSGFYTAFGPVEPLVSATDDAVAVFGPGEEIHLEFAVAAAPPAGASSRFVLELAGWCKDRDLYTKDGDTLAPLPSRAGAAAPGPRGRDALHERFNTRYQSGD